MPKDEFLAPLFGEAFLYPCPSVGLLGSPDKAGGEIPQTKRKVIHLHHEHTRTFSIGAVDSAIRDTFKL